MREDLEVAPGLVIPAGEIEESASRSSGPGGQNVNKTSTRVSLRWNLERSAVLDDELRSRLLRRLGPRLAAGSDLVVHADRHRSRARNLDAARRRMVELITQALEDPRPRRATRPTRASVERRMEAKRKRSGVKRKRGSVHDDD
ncbi:MAG: aminoacyl-tRNA hydrolase [Deltaproteobacteria bacterium]|nr:aminoacyl-tRNA hydrolase [Deltaproteobacteria bacterium]MBW2384240.1 aminoacyl-tRNA hydrolase [Deltaproteobacteria bacterium]MBW2695904.1 aminoacyl-tRNA hydrolase [Deltaproteobacteria bacterium]